MSLTDKQIESKQKRLKMKFRVLKAITESVEEDNISIEEVVSVLLETASEYNKELIK